MTGTVIPGEVFAWVAVFLLPINSALNPVLYTISSLRRARVGRFTFNWIFLLSLLVLTYYNIPTIKINMIQLTTLLS